MSKADELRMNSHQIQQFIHFAVELLSEFKLKLQKTADGTSDGITKTADGGTSKGVVYCCNM
jgi:hypothetical protein